MLSEEIQLAEKRQRQQRWLAKEMLRLAERLRDARRFLYRTACTSRPDLLPLEAYGRLRGLGEGWVSDLFELSAHLSIPAWTGPAEDADEDK